jgi:steroid delta-isomerase-like uncharacterized protein
MSRASSQRRRCSRPTLTPDRNKALVCRWLEEVFSRGDLDAADGLFTSKCALHDPSFPRDVYGSEGIKRYVCTYRVAFSDLEVTVEVQLAEEDKIVTRWTARGPHSGEFLGLAPTHQEKAVSGIGFDRVVAAASMRRGSATILSPGRRSTAGTSTAGPPTAVPP